MRPRSVARRLSIRPQESEQAGVEINKSSYFYGLNLDNRHACKRISLYKELDKPVIFVQHCDDELVPEEDSWNINSKIDFRKQDLFVRKTHANSFYKTNLKDLLDILSIHSIEFCGAQTEYCMDATIKFFHGLGYKNYMVRKATSTLNNAYMSAKETINFYENIWSNRFLEFIED
ncbi:isochorismatase family protein [Rummeliibacillus suwonensis]|uniref:isochorismatase family protein n=1 Tax=Rummeliibacillus suwonensis TaxID=1306154 RepID=UPI0011B5936C|nr:isochorismatase family protein [Rummeliibacillus suwonensis]